MKVFIPFSERVPQWSSLRLWTSWLIFLKPSRSVKDYKNVKNYLLKINKYNWEEPVETMSPTLIVSACDILWVIILKS